MIWDDGSLIYFQTVPRKSESYRKIVYATCWVYFTHLSKLLRSVYATCWGYISLIFLNSLEVPQVDPDVNILLILPSRNEIHRGVINGLEVLEMEAPTAVQQRCPEILLLQKLHAVAPQLHFWNPRWSRRGGEGDERDAIIDIVSVWRRQSGR